MVVVYRALTVSGAPFQGTSTDTAEPRLWVLQPRLSKRNGLGHYPVRSPLLGASQLISLPPGTEMFQFPGFASLSREMTSLTTSRVAPFGHLGINACVPLPRAFRSLPRPSSPPCAQASPTCLRLLDYKTPIAKQSTRDLSTSDNLAKVIQFRFAIPRSTTNFRCQTATPSAARVRGSLSNRNGN